MSGWALAKASSSPPTMMLRMPDRAPDCPPETGASRKEKPRAPAAAASSRAISADAVVWSTNTEPAPIAWKAPSGPIVTSRRSSSLPTQEKMKSAPSAAAAGVGAAVPPYSATQAVALAGVRL